MPHANTLGEKQIPLAGVARPPQTLIRHRALISVLLVTVLLYLPSLWFPFVYDDLPQILDNPRVQSWEHLPSYFTDHVWAQRVGSVQANYYRPLFLVWLLINYTLFETNPVGWHLTTVLVHVVVVGLGFAVARRFVSGAGAAWVALLFALHPLQIESVAWISGVPEPLAAIFLMGAFLAYLRAREAGARRWWVMSLGLYFGGLLCKETAAIYPAAVFLHALCWPPEEGAWWRRTKQAARMAFAYGPALVPYLLIRIWALEGMYRAQATADLGSTLLTLPVIVWTYIRLLVFPFRLAVHYDVQFIHSADVQFWPPLVGTILALAAVAWWVRRSRLLVFAVGWVAIFVTIPIASGRFFHEGIGLVHDRYLYLSLFGIALLLVAAWQRASLPVMGTQKAVPLLIVVAVVYGYGTLSQEFYWRSGYAIFQRALELYPDPRGPLKVLVAEQLMGEGKKEEAGKLYREALQESAHWYSTFGMASWHYEQGNYREAEELLLRTLPQYPGRYRQYFLLGMVRMSMERYAEAIPPLGKSVLLGPGSVENRLQFARALYAVGWLQPALTQYEIVLAQNPKEENLRLYVAALKKQAAGPPSRLPGPERNASPPGSPRP